MRLALISDIHEDLVSLQKALRRINRHGYDLLACLGDICGFNIPNDRHAGERNASACIALIREHCDVVIPGNHDLHAASRLPSDWSLFGFPDNWYELSVEERKDLGEGRLCFHDADLDAGLSEDDLTYLRALPFHHVLGNGAERILLSHYASPNLSGFASRFYSREKEFRPHFDFMAAHDCRLAFIGHGHTQGFYRADREHLKQYRFRKLLLKGGPQLIGVPALTRQSPLRGFCIYDTDRGLLRVRRIW